MHFLQNSVLLFAELPIGAHQHCSNVLRRGSEQGLVSLGTLEVGLFSHIQLLHQTGPLQAELVVGFLTVVSLSLRAVHCISHLVSFCGIKK